MPYLFGRHPVLEALKADRPVQKVFLSKNADRHTMISQILHLARQKGIFVSQVPPSYFDDLEGVGKTHQGVVALAAAKPYAEPSDLFAIAEERGEPPFFLLLDQLTDPHNLGAILRSCDAAGVHGVIIPKRRSVGLTETVSKTSAGAVEYVPVVQVGNLVQVIDRLKKENVWVYGIDLSGSARYNELDFRGAVALVVGAEGSGLSRVVKERCDGLVRIPMRGEISSLNASVASSLVLYEVYRQRRKKDFGL